MPTPSELAAKELLKQAYLARDVVVHPTETWHVASGNELAVTRLTVNGRVVVQGVVRVV